MDIKEYMENYLNDLQVQADTLMISKEEAFITDVIERLKESDIVSDVNIHYFKNKGRQNRIVEFNGYGYENSDGSYNLFVVDDLYDSDTNLTNALLEKLIKKLEELVYCSIEKRYTIWEPSSYGYEAANEIERLYNNKNNLETDFDLKRIRLFIITNKVLSQRFKNQPRKEIYNIPVEYSVYDANRLYDIARQGFEKEPVNISFSDYGYDGIFGIKCAQKDGEYESYLASIPGEVLAEMYMEYGNRILEANVRSFLSVRGKVNKGIRQTILTAPDKFFMLNNGVTITSDNLVAVEEGNGIWIKQIDNLQIVNGGQTTASLANAKIKSKADLSRIQVMMKLSVLKNKEIAEKLVPEISRASNSQNKVDEADFFSNHPFHIKIEDLSRRILAPAINGNQYQTCWFYERARGQYEVSFLKLTKAKEKEFKQKNPKNQVIKKTDLAKYYMTFEGYPHETSKGAQRVMREFSKLIQGDGDNDGLWEKNSSEINEQFFRDIVSKAILFKETEKIVSRQDWYMEIKAYRANIVAYTVAILNWYAKKNKKLLDLKSIWNRQSISSHLINQIKITAKEVYYNLLNYENRTTLNVTEWAKKEHCWAFAKKNLKWTILDEFKESLIEPVKHKKNEVTEATVDAMSLVVSQPSDLWEKMKNWGVQLGYLSYNDEQLLDLASKVQFGRVNLKDNQYKDIVTIYNKLVKEGYIYA